MDNINLGQILYLFFLLAFFVVLIPAIVDAWRARDNLLEIEKGRQPIHTEHCAAMVGLLNTRGRGMRVTIYDGLLVLKGEGEYVFGVNDITNLELSENLLGKGLKIKYRNRPYPPPIILCAADPEILKAIIETSLNLKSNPNYGLEENTTMPKQERRERKRWFWSSQEQ